LVGVGEKHSIIVCKQKGPQSGLPVCSENGI
jgi:hypothetical protein